MSNATPNKITDGEAKKNGAKTESANFKIKAAEKAEGEDSEPNKAGSE